MTLHGSDAWVLKRVQQSIWERKKTPATFCIVSQQKRNGRRTNGLQGATQVSFASCILHILRSLCAICVAETRRRCRNRWLSRGRRLAGWLACPPPLCGLLTDKLSPSGRCPGTVQRFSAVRQVTGGSVGSDATTCK